jgi:hypothetical protein
MPLEHLKIKHLARLSPVMHAYGQPFVREEEWVPIGDGMGVIGENYGHAGTLDDNYERAPRGTPVDPRGEALWSNLYRIGTAGSLSRVTPFGPAAFSGLGTNGEGVGPAVPEGPAAQSLGERVRAMAPLLLALGATVGVMYIINR